MTESRAGDRPRAIDDLTVRPTVQVRRGASRGSGTVIASTPGETLILTASHVVDVDAAGPPQVELHRYNLGLEAGPARGDWPRLVKAEVAAIDLAGDLAVLRVRGQAAWPYVARLAVDGDPPPPKTPVTSVGVDRTTHLSAWTTELRGVAWLEMADDGRSRPYLVTARPPDHGRSGGGLFDADGALIGVCVARVDGIDRGLFSAGPSIRLLLKKNSLDVAVARSTGARSGKVVAKPIKDPRLERTNAR